VSLSRRSSPTPSATRAGKSSPAAKKESKAGKVIRLLKRTEGASLKELMKATGWQAHSVRGYLSGTLRKKMALRVALVARENGEGAYRVPDNESGD
jgi:hypothetical protein